MSAPRFAIYFVPERAGALYTFGAALIGYDCYTGGEIAQPADLGIDPAEWSALTAAPRHYGFHATMKAPFRLCAPGAEPELAHALATFVARREPVPPFEIELRLLDGFAALVPSRPFAPLDALAADCVAAFDGFRAPPTADERARRLAAELSAAQRENVDRWGYPHVFDEFRWHMTLTGRLPAARQASVLKILGERFSALGDGRIASIDRLALVRQDDPGARFRVVHNLQLSKGS
jgi:putative phosphonate metabolism protein